MTNLQNLSLPAEQQKEIIILDASPLIYLSKMNLLDLLPAMYQRILIIDVVWMEATRDADKFEDAARTLKWGEKLEAEMPDRFSIAETGIGKGIRAVLKEEPGYKQRNAGENSIVEWAGNAADEIEENPYLKEIHPDILYENGKVPKLVVSLKLPVTTLNTVAFILEAEKAGHPINLKKVLEIIAERQVHFNLEDFITHNKAALKQIPEQEKTIKKKQTYWEKGAFGSLFLFKIRSFF